MPVISGRGVRPDGSGILGCWLVGMCGPEPVGDADWRGSAQRLRTDANGALVVALPVGDYRAEFTEVTGRVWVPEGTFTLAADMTWPSVIAAIRASRQGA